MPIEALLFDVFGTCVDWRTGVATEVARAAGKAGIGVDSEAFADAWRGRYQPAMQRIRSGERPYADLDVLHRENLDATLDEFAIAEAFDDPARMDLNHAWERLPPWPDTVPGLARLRERFIVAPCSNGSIALMTRLARFSGMTWDVILGAGVARTYKPDPQAYLRSLEAIAVAPENAMMVAAHNDDLEAAAQLGMKTAFVLRPVEHGPAQSTDLSPQGDWTVCVESMEELAEKLIR